MPIIAELLNHDEVYDEFVKAGGKPIIINDLPCTTESDKEKIKELTLTQLSSDTLSTVPSCGGGCNATRGKYALGKECPVCKNIVRSNIENSSKSTLWMRAPEGVRNLISPVVWKTLSTYFTKSNFDAISYLTDSAYSPSNRIPIEIDKLSRRNHERDLNYFIDNFDEIVLDLVAIYPEKPNRPYKELLDWLSENRKKIFSRFQPLASKNLFITDKTIVGIYMENSIKDALDTIYHFVSIDLDFYDRTPKVVVNRTARVLAKQAHFHHSYISTNFQPKPGHFRRQVLGSRNIFVARAVISSNTGDHKFDEVGIPWRIAVPMFQHHLMGKLMRGGLNHNDALGYLLKHVGSYSKLIHKYLDEIFNEFPGGRGPVFILHRN